jgi:glycosyltransferase involved in cell wall biosynthesis
VKLLVIDPYVTRESPSMRAWVRAFDGFRDCFDEIEIWAFGSDIPTGNGVTWQRIPARLPTWKLRSFEFEHRVNSMLSNSPPGPDTLIQTTGCPVMAADIHLIQFWHRAFRDECRKRPEFLKPRLIERLLSQRTARREAATAALDRPHRQWWVVSRSLAENIQSEGASGEFHILPNQYDPARFHSGIRNEWREKMRAHHGFAPDEKILAFSAFGHFERKGLRQGIEAVAELRRRGHAIRYLILGGTPSTLKSFRQNLSPENEAACIFAGMVDHIERHLVAADALLFPSHFEAFSLAEIEAAALGLRLYLTPHYGSEMILREPVNGRWLPWQPHGMADTIETDIQSGQLGTTHTELGEALTPDAYATRLRDLYSKAILAHRTK